MRALVMMLEALRVEMRASALAHTVAMAIQTGPMQGSTLEQSSAVLSDLRMESDRTAERALREALSQVQ